MKVLKKIGCILFCLLPVLLAFGLQLLITFAGLALRAFYLFQQDPSLVGSFSSPEFQRTLLGDSQFLMALSAIYGISSALVLGFWYWKWCFPKKRPRRKPSAIINPAMALGIMLMVVGLQYISSYLIMAVAAIHPAWYNTYESLMENAGFGNVTPMLALYSVLIAPISEELIFRGITLKYATKAMPFFLANIFQAFLFGVFHGNVVQGVYAFAVGLFCGYICIKGSSIYLSILFHMLFNLWGTFQPDFLSYSGTSIFIHLGILAGAAILAFTGIFLYQRGANNRTPARQPAAPQSPK